jgi:hypothetical protein
MSLDQPGVIDGEEFLKSEDDAVSECSHCFEMRYFDPAVHLNKYRFFHQPCLEPRCSRFKALQSVLCDSCRHLRLWHLVNCMRSENRKGFAVVILPGKDFAASLCPLCRMIGISMLSMGWDPATFEYPTHFHLDVSKLHEADDTNATVSLIDTSENVILLKCTVDLQIITRHDGRFKNA